MKTVLTTSLLLLLASCGGLSQSLGPGAAERDRLWREAHHAMGLDSFRIATAAFQRLANAHPNTMEGREALFFVATMYLDPANPAMDPAAAAQSLELYLARDTANGERRRALRWPEAESLLALSRELTIPCEQRQSPLRCDPVEIVRRVTVPVPGPGEGGAQPAPADGDAARLRTQLAERDATIRQLREELRRIRETLAPPP
jgi:hypothetical protein